MPSLIPAEYHPYSLRDAALALSSCRKPAAGPPVALTFPGIGEGTALRSARAAVIIALKALDLPAGANVGVPLYCCPVVFKAVQAAGCRPRFIDVEADSHCLSVRDLETKSRELDAVIAVHMFGHLCDMPEILRIMRGRPVIEDCAQSLGSRLDDRPCGSFGDAAFFSFRSGKYLAVGEGAALFAKDPGLAARMAGLVAALPVPTRAEEFGHVLNTLARSTLRSRPWWGLVGAKIWAVYNERTDFVDKSPIVLGRMFASDLAVFRRRLPRLEGMIAAQKAHARRLNEGLRLGKTRLPAEPVWARTNGFMYPLVFETVEDRKAMAAFLKRRGVGTATPYEHTPEGAAENYGYQGDCPSAERLLARTLVLPSYYALRPRDLARIVRLANEGWALIRNAQPKTSLRP